MKKKSLAIFLAAVLTAAMLPTAVMGDELTAGDLSGEEAVIEEEASLGVEALPEADPAGIEEDSAEGFGWGTVEDGFPAVEDFEEAAGDELAEDADGTPLNGATDISQATVSGLKDVYRYEYVSVKKSGGSTSFSRARLYDFKTLFDGKAISKPNGPGLSVSLKPTLKLNGKTLVEGTDYTVNPINIPLPIVVGMRLQGIGNYTGTLEIYRPLACSYTLAGKNRYETNAMLIDLHGELDFERIVVVTGEKFPDALAANAYAGIKNSPLVLTKTDKVPPATEDLLKAYKDEIKEVVVIGGDLKKATDAMKKILPKATFRTISGKNRYRTADAVTEAFIKEYYGSGEITGPVFVTTGQTPADALSASTWSYLMHIPVLLVKDKKADAATQKILKRFKNVYLLGDAKVVADSNVPSGAKKTRLGGKNRWETSRKIADHFLGKVSSSSSGSMGPSGYMKLYAPGEDELFPDALAAGQFNPVGISAVILVKESKANLYINNLGNTGGPSPIDLTELYNMCIGSAGKDAGSGSAKGKIYNALMKNVEKRMIQLFAQG